MSDDPADPRNRRGLMTLAAIGCAIGIFVAGILIGRLLGGL